MDGCPPLEDIAAFLDGTLSSQERARMTEHLARCESCYEIFAGAVHFQEEEEDSSAEDTGGRGVIRFPLRDKEDRAPRRIARWLPLAASFFLVAALGFMIWQYSRTLPEITVAGLVEPLQAQPRIIEQRYQPKDVQRGVGGEEGITSPAPPFLAGVYFVDLRLSAKAGDVKTTRGILYDLQSELAQVLGMQGPAKSLKEEADRMKDPAGPTALQRFTSSLPRWESNFQSWFAEDPFFAFGVWTEAGRLSAVIKSPELFEQRVNRRFLSGIQREIRAENDERYTPILDDLRKIEDLWDERRPEDYQALARHFQSIIDQMEQIQKQDRIDSELPELPSPPER